MSQITLKSLDDGQKAVEISLGKTTIGRGPFLGCFDKKVSRNHAVLEVTSKGEVYLTPTHVSPCFYQPTPDSSVQILKKNTPHKLENGDFFSLLPWAYRYQLIVVEDPKLKQENTDQNDLHKQSGKTNGSTGVGFEEGVKARFKIEWEGVKARFKNECNEEQGDTITGFERTPTSFLSSTFAAVVQTLISWKPSPSTKKFPNIKEEKMPSSIKENETKKEKEMTEKEVNPPEENNVADAKATENNGESPTEHSKTNADEQSKPSVDKVSEENESTSHADFFPENGVSDVAIDALHEDKAEKSIAEENSEVKRTDNCEESQKEDTLDMETIVDVKPSSEPISQNAKIKYKEPTEDGFCASSLVKEGQSDAQEKIVNPTPVPSMGGNCVNTQPNPCRESIQSSKHKPVLGENEGPVTGEDEEEIKQNREIQKMPEEDQGWQIIYEEDCRFEEEAVSVSSTEYGSWVDLEIRAN